MALKNIVIFIIGFSLILNPIVLDGVRYENLNNR
jgi:hypothetical protein